MNSEDNLKKVFQPLLDHFLDQDMDEPELHEYIADMAIRTPEVAYAYSMHLAQTIRDMESKDDLADCSIALIAAEAYYRTYFHPAYAEQFGTNYFNGDCKKLQEFVEEFLITQREQDKRIFYIPTSLTVH